MQVLWKYRTRLLLICIISFITGLSVLAQCPSPSGNQHNFNTNPAIGGAFLTPATIDVPVSVSTVWGGQYVPVTVEDGKRYRFSLVGSDARVAAAFPTLENPQAEFDPIMTIQDNTGTGDTDGAVVGFNDNFSATEKFPELEYTATYSGLLFVMIDPAPGTDIRNSQGTTVAQPGSIVTCASFAVDSTSLQVTQIPVAPVLASGARDNDTQITVSFSANVATNGGNPTDFMVVDGLGTNFPVSAQTDGTVGDTDIILTVADLSVGVGDLIVTYTNNNNEISDAGTSDVVQTDATGVVIDVDTGPPTLSSATNNSDTQITVTLSEPVQTSGTNPTDFTVVDALGTNFAVSAQADGTANDANIVLTVADLSTAVGDLTVTYTNNNNEISDFGSNNLATDAIGVTIDADATAPTLASATKDGNTQITVTLSEVIQTNGTNPTDFIVVDGVGTNFAVSTQADGTANDTDIVLTVADLSTAVGDLTVTYVNNNNEVSDFGGNELVTNAMGVTIDSDMTTPTVQSAEETSNTQITITFSEAVFFEGTDGGVFDGFTVTDGLGTTYAVSALTDGTAKDTQMILTVATTENAVGDLKVAFNATTDENRIFDFGGNGTTTNATGVTIDTDSTDPTLVSGTADSDTQLTITFSESVQVIGDTPDDFTVVDADNTPFIVSQVTDGTAEDDKIILTVADFSAATGPLTVTYAFNCSDISDFGGNALQDDATGIDIALATVVSSVDVPSSDTYGIGDELNFEVNFSDPVTITGTSSIVLTIGGTNVNATLSGTVTSTTSASFTYTILSGEEDTDGIAVGSVIDLNGGTIRDGSNQDVLLNLNSVGITAAVLIDGIAPAMPVIVSVSGDTGRESDDLITNDQSLFVRGTAEANSRLSLSVGGEGVFGGIIITVDSEGDWEFSPEGEGTFTLEEGMHTYTATTEDAAGNQSAVSENFVVTIDQTAPVAPTLNLATTADLGVSNTDNLTSGLMLTFNGTAEANSLIVILLVDEEGNPVDGSGAEDADLVLTDENGDWTYIVGNGIPTGSYPLGAFATDVAGNVSVSSTILALEIDQDLAISTTSPTDGEIDVLPNANLTITFDKNVVLGNGNITVIQSSNDAVQQTIDVTSDLVTIDGAVVTINPAENILPSDTEFYINMAAGTFENEAGAPFAGISDNTTWNFTIIAASVVSSVEVPANDTYVMGEELDFTVNMILPVTITGSATIPVTIGTTVVNATQVGTVSNASAIVFRYTVLENQLDTDGVAVGSAINLNGGTIRDEFDIDAILTINNVATTENVFVDAVAPLPGAVFAVNVDSNNSDDLITNDNTLLFGGIAINEGELAEFEDKALFEDDTYEFFLDGTSIGSVGSTIMGTTGSEGVSFILDHTGTVLADGSYAMSIVSTDPAGNTTTGTGELVRTLIVDTQAPGVPTIDLDVSSDLGISARDDVTYYNTTDKLNLSGTAEANSIVELTFVYDGITSSGNTVTADGSGNWTFEAGAVVAGFIQVGSTENLLVRAMATDAAGNQGTEGTLTIVVDQGLAVSILSPANDEIDVLPNANLVVTFDKNLVKGTGNITIKEKGSDRVQETIDVTGSNVTVNGAVVTINPVNNILPPDTDFYINIDAGVFENEAGAPFAGITDDVTWGFTIIAASVVSSVDVPANDTYVMGEELDFTVNMILPVTITGSATIPVTIGTTIVNATQVGTVSNASAIVFRYTVLENQLDTDGVAVGSAINLNGGTMRDEFDVDAILTINNVAITENVFVDAVAPLPGAVFGVNVDSNNSDDLITNDNTLLFGGIAIGEEGILEFEDRALFENDTYEFFLDGTSIGSVGSTIMGATGSEGISFILDHTGTVLADGSYAMSIVSTDPAGNTTTGTGELVRTLVVDTQAPAIPTIDLDAASDLGISATDNQTYFNTTDGLNISGTAEANATIELSFTYNGITVTGNTTAVDALGNWTFDVGAVISGFIEEGSTEDLLMRAVAIDAAGNQGSEGTLTIVVDQGLAVSILSPANDEMDVLPNANLVVTFDKNVLKGTGNIIIKENGSDRVQETIDVTGSNVTVNGAVVTINPVNNILPPDTDFYISIDAGVFENEAGAPFAGITDDVTWGFTIIAASVVSSVDVPADATYMIGDNLDFTVNMILPISITGTATIPVTIGSTMVNATQVGTVSNSSTIQFRYTVVEDDLDADGIAVGSAMNLNGGTMRDEFSVDAILTLNNVASTTAVLVDAVKPTPVITSEAVDLVNGTFSATVTFDEAVENFAIGDLTVINGTASNLMNTTTGTTWTVDITPAADGTVIISLAANTVTDIAGNANNASNSISREFDGTPPVVTSINRKDADPLTTGTSSADFRIIFSESVSGVDLTDLEVVLTATATGALNSIAAVDGQTYDVTVDGIGGQGTIGLNMKDDDSIEDAATNTLAGTFTGQVYTTNFIPTDLTLSISNADENNALNEALAILSTTDADAGDSHTYTLVAGTGDTDNASFTIDGSMLRANNLSFNFEDKDSYDLRLKTDDSKGGTFEKAFTFAINDLNEVPIMLSLSNNSIDESDNAQPVGDFSTLDQDGGDTFTYTLVSGTGDAGNGEFTISGTTLSTAGLINFEDGATRSILVRVTDSGGLNIDQQFSINIGEVVIEALREYESNIPGGAVRNVFSPNGDGVNETWVIEDLLDNPINEVKVYAQGGKLIYSQVNYQNDWDGTFKGDPIPDGTYYYEINVYDGERIIKGFLTIIRNR